MKVLIAFLLGTFLLSGTRLGDTARRHPILLLAGTAMVAMGYYSLRVVQ